MKKLVEERGELWIDVLGFFAYRSVKVFVK